MPDKKLTDNEIIKGLKELLEIMCCEGGLQRAATISNTIDLINRLQAENSNLTFDFTSLKNDLTSEKAENERLKNNITTLTRSISELTAEVERQRKDKDDAFLLAADIVNADKIVRAEAYKEYHTKAKACLKANRDIEQQIGNTYAAKTIKEIENRFDNLLKGMVGDTDV